MSLRFKPEVRIGYFNEHLRRMFEIAAAWSFVHKMDVQVNSIADPAPGRVPDSQHPFDLAIDMEPVGNVDIDRASLGEYCRKHFDPQFTVLLENNHIHVEWNAHRPPLQLYKGT